MNVKLSSILGSQAALGRLSQEKFAPTTTPKIMRTVRLFRPEIEDFEKVHMDLVKKLCIEDTETGNWKVTPEYVAEIGKLDVNIELAAEKISISLLDKEISAEDLLALEWMLDLGDDSNGTDKKQAGQA